MPTVPEEIITAEQIDDLHLQKIADNVNAHGIAVTKEDIRSANESAMTQTPELVQAGAEFVGSLAEDLTRPVLGGSLVETASSKNFLQRLKEKLRRTNPTSEFREVA